MPIMATLSFIPSAISVTPFTETLGPDRYCLPIVAVYAPRYVMVFLAEAQLHGHADAEGFKVAVIQIEEPSPAALEVDKAVDCGRTEAEGQEIAGGGEYSPTSIGAT